MIVVCVCVCDTYFNDFSSLQANQIHNAKIVWLNKAFVYVGKVNKKMNLSQSI